MIDPFNSNSTCTDSSSLSFDWSKLLLGFVASSIQLSIRLTKILALCVQHPDAWTSQTVEEYFLRFRKTPHEPKLNNKKQEGKQKTYYFCVVVHWSITEYLRVWFSFFIEHFPIHCPGTKKTPFSFTALIPSKLIGNIKYMYLFFYLTVHAAIIIVALMINQFFIYVF